MRAAVRADRAAAAQAYFRSHAAEWDRIRKLHVTDAAVEAEISAALAFGASETPSMKANANTTASAATPENPSEVASGVKPPGTAQATTAGSSARAGTPAAAYASPASSVSLLSNACARR